MSDRVKEMVNYFLNGKPLKDCRPADNEWRTAEEVEGLFRVYFRDLTKQLSARDEAIKLLLSFAPKDCPEGLDPTFYFTLTYAGDKEIQDRIDGIRAALPQEDS